MQTDGFKKFGLIMPKKDKNIFKKSVFDQGDEEDKSSKFGLSDQSKSKMFLKKQTQLHIESALSQDANIFDYDANYEDDKKRKIEKEEQRIRQICQTSKPKYMGNLLKQAEERKKDKMYRAERKVAKERKQEEDEGLFQDKEKYETGAYRESKRKMMEEQRLRDEALKEVDSGDFSGFYKHLFDQKTKESLSEDEEQKSAKKPKEDETIVDEKTYEKKVERNSYEQKDRYDSRRKEHSFRRDVADKKDEGKIKETKNEEDKPKKVLPDKKTSDIELAKERYLARKNKLNAT